MADLTDTIEATSEEIDDLVHFAQTYAAWMLVSAEPDSLTGIGVDVPLGDDLADTAGLNLTRAEAWDDSGLCFTTWAGLESLNPELNDVVDAYFDAPIGSNAGYAVWVSLQFLMADYLLEVALDAQATVGG